jgi:hypothetical protein
MKKTRIYLCFEIALAAAVSAVGTAGCKTHLNSSRNNPGEDKTYHLRFNPSAGAAYHFETTNESDVSITVDDKEVESRKKTETGMNYRISRDSGEYTLEMSYDRIHFYAKNGDVVTDVDANDPQSSYNSMGQLLSGLKTATIVARVNSAGAIRSVTGYQEVIDRILATNYGPDAEKAKVRLTWQQLVEQGIVRKNMDQLIRQFPDSALHVGDRWKLSSAEKDEINFRLENVYQLESIDGGIATIRSEGEVSGDSTASQMMGYSVTSDLKGKEQGIYQVDIVSGMPVDAEISAEIQGTVYLQGREAQVKMNTKTKLSGKVIK